MRIGTTIIAVLLAVAGVFAMLSASRFTAGRGMASGPHRLLQTSELPVDEIDRVTIVRRDAPTMVFKRGAAATDWRQVEPFDYPMDPFSMRQMAIAARELVVLDRIAPESLGSQQTLSTLQLAPPAGEITFQWPGGSFTLELGRRSVAGRAYLRKKGDDAVCIVQQRLHERVLDMSPTQWRDRQIFQRAGAESQSISWQQGDVTLTLVREGRRWAMMDPQRTRVDAVNMDAYLQALGRADVTDFILDAQNEADLSSFGLTKPVASLTVTTHQSSSARVASNESDQPHIERLLVGAPIGANAEDRFAMIEGRPVVFRLNVAAIQSLFRTKESLADPTGSAVKPADVKMIAIRTASTELRLERDLDTWRAPDHDGIEINAQHAQELLDQLCTLRARDVQFKPYPRELEIASVTLYGFDGKAIDTIRIAQEKESASTALENGDNVLRVFPQGLTLRLTPVDYGLTSSDGG